MDVGQDLSSEVKDVLEDKVNDSLGNPEETPEGESVHHEGMEKDEGERKQSRATLEVQKRLKSQKRAHEREVRELHARIGDLEARMSQPQMSSSQDQTVNPSYSAAPQGGSIDDTIHKAVGIALQHKENEERKAHEARAQQEVNKEHQGFLKHLDGMGDKYDDFHDVVFSHDTPFTPAMHNYAMTLPRNGAGSAGEVLYKLAKNPELLERIGKLHPLKQGAELAALSHALISGGDSKGSQSKAPLNNIRNSPVSNSHQVTEKTPVSDLRARMRSGSWK